MALLSNTSMVDFAMDVHKSLYPDQDIPQTLVDKRAQVWLLNLNYFAAKNIKKETSYHCSKAIKIAKNVVHRLKEMVILQEIERIVDCLAILETNRPQSKWPLKIFFYYCVALQRFYVTMSHVPILAPLIG